ncbi:MAG: hypothetical protein KDD11_23755 [Acidobacteria bacterium]|nr:hypothetical protein [Acidobacteriota bacterium]
MHPLDRVLESFERALETSPADFTELVWFESRRRRAGSSHVGTDPETRPTRRERCTLIRVVEGGRCGRFRSDCLDVHQLTEGIRQAMAQARVAPVEAAETPGTPEPGPDLPREALFDTRLARLRPRDGLERVTDLADPDTAVAFEWSEGRLLVVNSSGLSSRARVTGARLTARNGRGLGQGVGLAAGRTLEDLDALGLIELARQRRVGEALGEEAPAGAPVVLSPEAVAALFTEIAACIFQSGLRQAARDSGDLAQALGFSPLLHLADDPRDLAGMPFPFDLRGRPPQRVSLIDAGRLSHLPAVGEAAADDERLPGHLVLGAGTASEEELLAAAEGGVWIGSLDRVDARQAGVVRGRARQRRRIAGGRLAAALPDATWEEGLEDVLAPGLELGRRVLRQSRDGVLGGATAPSLAYRLP